MIKKVKCSCKDCTIKSDINNMYAVKSFAAGKTKIKYFCEYHFKNLDGGYTTENGFFVNKKVINNFTYSIEMEISHCCNKSLEELSPLKLYNWIATPDCTVKVEYKTPIYQNKNAIIRVLKSFDKIAEPEQWNSASDYGTHLNMNCNGIDIEILRKFYGSIFSKASYYIYNHKEYNKELFGRGEASSDFQWCAPIPEGYSYQNNYSDHALMWNLQHTTHVELRLPRYQNCKQYSKVIDFEKEVLIALSEVCESIKNNRIKISNITELKEANKKDCENVSLKIINIYNKFVGLPRINKTKNYISR